MDILVPGSRLGLAPLCILLVYIYISVHVCTVMNVSLEFACLSIHISCLLHVKQRVENLMGLPPLHLNYLGVSFLFPVAAPENVYS